MDDYISRKELIEHIKAHCGGCDNCTRQSVFLERYPNARLDDDNVLVICPRSIEQNGCDKFDDHILMCSDCRRKYWSEEVQDEDEG